MSDPSREDRIRVKAYEIWDLEGRADGREFDHWILAEAAIVLEEGAPDIVLVDGTPVTQVNKAVSFGQHADAAAELSSTTKPAVNGTMHQQGIGG